jgi:hypothetical protein
MGLIIVVFSGTLAMVIITDSGTMIFAAKHSVLFVKNEEVHFILFT